MNNQHSNHGREAVERKLRDLRAVYPLVLANPHGGWLAVIEHTVTYFDENFTYAGKEPLRLSNPVHAQLYLQLGKAKRERAGEYREPLYTSASTVPLDEDSVDDLFTFGDQL